MSSSILEKDELTASKFIDFDKYEKIIYNNIYLDEFKIVIKMPCVGVKKKINQNIIKIEKFDLGKYDYLFSYD